VLRENHRSEPMGYYQGAYYAMSNSPYREPAEQFDPILLVNFWNRISGSSDRDKLDMTVLVAGKYRLFNLSSDQDPYACAKQWEMEENRKKDLLESAFGRLMDSTPSASVKKLDSLWNYDGYWYQLLEYATRLDPGQLRREWRGKDQPVEFGQLPVGLLGAIRPNVREKLAKLRACDLYLPAVLAEATNMVWDAGASIKVGPASEENFDKYIRQGGYATVQVKNPLSLSSTWEFEIVMSPFVGRKGQKRFYGMDAEKPGLEQELASRLGEALDYGGGPLDQWRCRIALWKARSEEEFGQVLQALGDRFPGPKSDLAREIASFLRTAFAPQEKTAAQYSALPPANQPALQLLRDTGSSG
jgi:hypothetical protein